MSRWRRWRRRTCELTGALPRTGVAEVRVDDADGYQPDNARTLALDPAPAVPIAVVVADPTGSTGGLYLERALNVAGGGREFRVDVRRWPRGGEVDAGRSDAPGGGVRARHAHARSRAAATCSRPTSPAAGRCCWRWAPTSMPARSATCLASTAVARRGAGAHAGRDAGRQRRPSSHLSSVSEPVRRAGRRPSGAAPASKRSGGIARCWRGSRAATRR